MASAFDTQKLQDYVDQQIQALEARRSEVAKGGAQDLAAKSVDILVESIPIVGPAKRLKEAYDEWSEGNDPDALKEAVAAGLGVISGPMWTLASGAEGIWGIREWWEEGQMAPKREEYLTLGSQIRSLTEIKDELSGLEGPISENCDALLAIVDRIEEVLPDAGNLVEIVLPDPGASAEAGETAEEEGGSLAASAVEDMGTGLGVSLASLSPGDMKEMERVESEVL